MYDFIEWLGLLEGEGRMLNIPVLDHVIVGREKKQTIIILKYLSITTIIMNLLKKFGICSTLGLSSVLASLISGCSREETVQEKNARWVKENIAFSVEYTETGKYHLDELNTFPPALRNAYYHHRSGTYSKYRPNWADNNRYLPCDYKLIVYNNDLEKIVASSGLNREEVELLIRKNDAEFVGAIVDVENFFASENGRDFKIVRTGRFCNVVKWLKEGISDEVLSKYHGDLCLSQKVALFDAEIKIKRK